MGEVPSFVISTSKFDLVMAFFFIGDFNRGFVNGFSDTTGSFDRSVEISDPLVPPPDVESSAPLEVIELFMPVTDF